MGFVLGRVHIYIPQEVIYEIFLMCMRERIIVLLIIMIKNNMYHVFHIVGTKSRGSGCHTRAKFPGKKASSHDEIF